MITIENISKMPLESVEKLIKDSNYSRPLMMRSLLERRDELISNKNKE